MPRTKDNALGTAALGQRPTASCRLDWLSVSLFGATANRQREQLGYFFGLLQDLSDGATWSEPSPAKFFANSVSHEAGLSIKWTEPSSGETNQGLISVDIRGQAFQSLDRDQRRDLYLDIAEMEGFKQCTRLDAQRTVLRPSMSAEQIHEALLDQALWVRSFRGFRQMGVLSGREALDGGSTVMWGSPQSAVRARSYNKAVEASWDIPAVRHEVQLRKQPARDKFSALIDELQREDESKATTVETAFVQSVLNQHMAYYDTRRLARRRKKDWPKDWAQQCEKAEWWTKEVVTGDPKEIKTQWRLAKKLEDSVAASDVQYGRILGKWMISHCLNTGETPEEALLTRSAQWLIRLKDEDLEELFQLVPKEQHDELVKNWAAWRQDAAHNAEA